MTGKTILYAEDEYTDPRIMEIHCRNYGVKCVLESDRRNLTW